MSALHWFEIPVTDIQRAAAFYGRVLGTDIHIIDMTAQTGSLIGMLPDRGGSVGALVLNSAHGYTPSMAGSLVYLIVDGALDDAMTRASAAGGQVLLPKTPLGEGQGGGFIGWITDTEGNRVGLYAKA